MDIVARAKEMGAVINSSALCLPAQSVLSFVQATHNSGCDVIYLECLYFYEKAGATPDGTEPSMELSRDAREFSRFEDFLADVGLIAREAGERASRKGVRAFFQVGLSPEPGLNGYGIPVRM